MLQFTQKQPHPALRHYLRGYWLIEAGDTMETLELVPDGYPEIFFTLAASVRIFSGGKRWQQHAQAGLIGQTSGRFAFEPAAGSRVLYVKLYPWAPAALFHIPAWQLTDVALEMEAVSSDPAFRNLSDQIYTAENFDQATTLLDAFFLKKMASVSGKMPYLPFAVQQIYASNGTVGMDQLTTRVHASRRYLEKIFKEGIGMSPKQYARIIRVKKASMYMLDPGFTGNLQTIADALQYYDQSHFLKDFKAVVRQTPTAFLQQQPNFPIEGIKAYLGQWDYS